MIDETLDKSIRKSGVLEADKTPAVQVEGIMNDKIEQLDGVNDFVDGKDSNEYEGLKNFWKRGCLVEPTKTTWTP